MHPSPSVIIFTALSGLGFGLLVFLGLKMPDVTGVLAFIFFVIGFGLAVGGLISSTFHLGRPERSIKAFKQWRSSWLSREAIAAVFTLSVMAVYAIGRIFFDYDIRILGIAGAIMSILTVALFLGGWSWPFGEDLGTFWQIFLTITKSPSSMCGV